MANAEDTMNYLMNAYEMAPAGTRDEASAAKELAKVFHEHGLETVVRTFNYKTYGTTMRAACVLLVALAGIIAGCSRGALPIVMFAIALAAAVIYVLEIRGIKTISRLGPNSSSQNIIARHPAAVAAGGQKKRPVVVVAHYDTPRISPFSTPLLARCRAFIQGIVHVCGCVVLGCIFLEMFPVPTVFHSILWAIALLASIVLLVWGVCTILHQLVLPHTYGANNNRSSIAAVFGLLDRVRPVDGPIGSSIPRAPEAVSDVIEEGDGADGWSATSRFGRPAAPVSKNIRHGEEVVRALGVLPASCVIEYLADEAVIEPAQAAMAVDNDADAALEDDIMVEQILEEELDPEVLKDRAADAIMETIMGTAEMSAVHPVVQPDQNDLGATSLMSAIPDVASVSSQMPAQVSASQTFNVITTDDAPDAELRHLTGELPADIIRQNVSNVPSFDADEPSSQTAAVVESSDWGTTSFTPVNVSRRLLGDDIPDPAVAAVDPYSVSSVEMTGDFNPEDFSQIDFETGTHEAVTPAMLEEVQRRNLDGFSPEFTERPSRRNRKNKKGRSGRISHQAAQMQAEMEEQSFTDWMGLDEDFDAKSNGREIGSWANFNDDANSAQPGAPKWQGGATRSRRPRKPVVVSNGNEDREVRQAAMTLGDRDLAEHEIWFVLTGASESGNIGANDFYERFRDEIRGAYIVNLDCIGAGRPSLIIEEGLGRHVKADRRLVNLFGEASTNINRPLALERLNWCDTDGTSALIQNCRAVTVCGIEDGAPALEYSSEDTIDNVDAGQINDVVDILVEVVKNA